MNAAIEDEAAIGLEAQLGSERNQGYKAQVVDRMRQNYLKHLDE